MAQDPQSGGHTGGRREVVGLSNLHTSSMYKSLYFLPLSAARGQGSLSPSSLLSGKVCGLLWDWQQVMSRARRSCCSLGGDPWLITSAGAQHVTQQRLRQTEHFVLTLCTPLPASCPLIPQGGIFLSHRSSPCLGPLGERSRVIIYCLPQATPSDFSFDLQTALPK